MYGDISLKSSFPNRQRHNTTINNTDQNRPELSKDLDKGSRRQTTVDKIWQGGVSTVVSERPISDLQPHASHSPTPPINVRDSYKSRWLYNDTKIQHDLDQIKQIHRTTRDKQNLNANFNTNATNIKGKTDSIYQSEQHKEEKRGWDSFNKTSMEMEREKILRQFYSSLVKPKEKAVLSSGCPDRGIGNRVTSLVFVKVHKSASTTVANMLARYALRYSLHIALPRKNPGTERSNYFDDMVVPEAAFPIPSGQQYQVLFNHLIFHRQHLQVFMPKDTFYFAIMRNPEDRFLSSFIYYNFTRPLKEVFGVRTLKRAFIFMISHPNQVGSFKPEVYNSLAGDTGLHFSQHQNIRAIQAHMKKLEKDLDLIMVVEYFDESLVLLKRKACLLMQDIIYMAKNVRTHRPSQHLNLTPKERLLFETFQMADVIMYDYFYQRFWEMVYTEDVGFFQEVQHFKQIQRTVGDFCGRVNSVWDFVTISRSEWNEEFLVTARDCELMMTSEMSMQTYLVDRAEKLYAVSEENKVSDV